MNGALDAFNSLFRSGVEPQTPTNGLHTLPLWKQYVPIERNGSTVAYKTAYFGDIYIGNPNKQAFSVVFDTGSGHLILPSTSCESETCLKHRRYSRGSSAVAVDIEHDGTPILDATQARDQLRISFGTGEVMGEFVQDEVCLTGVSGAPCSTQRVVLATSMTAEPFGLFKFDGVLGLGLGSLALNEHFSFFGQMSQQAAIMRPVFAVFLARSDAGQSAISFGGYQEKCLASDVTWAPVAMPDLGYWQVRIQNVSIGGKVLDECRTGECRAILDTGTSLLGVPRSMSRTMHRLLARTVPTELATTMGTQADCRQIPGASLEFDLGNSVVSLDAEDYSRPKPYNITVPGTTDDWRLWCRSLLLPLEMKEPLGPLVFIWGEPMLRKYYTIYDWAEKQVGFAVAGESPLGTALAGGASSTAIGSPPPGTLVAGAPLAPGSSAVGGDGAVSPVGAGASVTV